MARDLTTDYSFGTQEEDDDLCNSVRNEFFQAFGFPNLFHSSTQPTLPTLPTLHPQKATIITRKDNHDYALALMRRSRDNFSVFTTRTHCPTKTLADTSQHVSSEIANNLKKPNGAEGRTNHSGCDNASTIVHTERGNSLHQLSSYVRFLFERSGDSEC